MQAGAPARSRRGGAPWLPAIAGVALIAALLALDWFGPGESVSRGFEEAREIQEQFGGPDVIVPDVSETGWDALGPLGRLVLVAAGLAGICLTVLRSVARPPVSPFAASAVAVALGTAATALVLYHLVNPPDDMSREVGVFAGLVAAGALAVGGWIALEEEER